MSKSSNQSVAHLSNLSASNLSADNQKAAADFFGVTTESLQSIAANVQSAPVAERPVKDDPKKVATIRNTIAYVLRSVRIPDKSPSGVARKCAQALNKAGVAAERHGEPVWTTASTLEEIGRLTKAGLLK